MEGEDVTEEVQVLRSELRSTIEEYQHKFLLCLNSHPVCHQLHEQCKVA
jgi:hypothetical protein